MSLATNWSDVTSQTRPVCRLEPALGEITPIVVCALGKKPELINYILTTSSSKPSESDKYFPCKKVDTSVVISVPASPRARNWKLTSFSRFNLPPATFMENWRQQVCLCSAMCLHVNECQCPLATIECRQCVDIVVLTDDNVPMLDNQCYTPIISCAGQFHPDCCLLTTSHIRGCDLRWHEDTERGRWMTEADFLLP